MMMGGREAWFTGLVVVTCAAVAVVARYTCG